DIHYLALDKGELALAEVARKKASDIDAESITSGVELLGPLDRGDMLNEAFVGLSLASQGEDSFQDNLPSFGSIHRHSIQQKILKGSSNSWYSASYMRNQVLPPGTSLGSGLTTEAAKELGLRPGVPVAASLIDAHAGGLGVIGADVRGHGLICEGQPVTSRLAVICGTSSCHMGISKDPIFVPGVWGPYFSAMVPGFWLNEGGQSVTGKLIDHLVQGHPAFPELQAKATARCQSIYAYLNSHLDLIKKAEPVGFLTVDLHVWPDFHGNRSPLADLTLKGMVTGLKLSQDLDDLAILYLATVQAIAFGTRFIIEAMETAGHSISTLFLCGGLSKNPLFVQMHADITGMSVVLSQEVESVLVGAAILGACASGDFTSVQEAMARMSKVGKVVFPRLEDKKYYDKKYQVFLKLVEHQKEYSAIMSGD
ncbi:Hypothetical predicted protein, partial [Marmota monax]